MKGPEATGAPKELTKGSAKDEKEQIRSSEAGKKNMKPAKGSTEDDEMDTEDDVSTEESVFVMPGDFVGTTEEFVAGNGTYVNVADIHSLSTGYVKIDKKSRTISIVPQTSTPPEIAEGDIIVGNVVNMRDSVALVEIGAIKGKGEREFQTNGAAAIHVSNVKDSYVKNLGQEFALSDIVKAKVINTQNMRLSTDGETLGVMKAYCSRCRSDLVKDNNRLKCPECGRVERRKISSEYGTGIF
ncbi:exosome complex RNA-binding protein Csl4 [Methanolobus mangrovi]|uniref:Exosome complex component Csl4 n=1 Tax=Methanolobus mangrovi TaxID=3072977 RepID=A0AA51UFT4_9EURY|nr:exosome complex RNA-binding protein Csl4 [Methanolobus mangrovi]WMW22149.1 exosome complex RNA-binding protein Csl4 [Methanolobus mangrovi]